MHHTLRMSFQWKLLLLFLLFSIVPLVTVALIVYETVRVRFEEVLLRSFAEQVALEERIIVGLFDSSRSLVQSLAAQQTLVVEVEQAAAGEAFNEDLLFLSLVAVRRENPFLERVYILGQDGTVLVSTASSDKGLSFAEAPAYREPLRSRTSYVGATRDSVARTRVFPVSTVLVRRSDNTPLGVLVIELNVAAINAAIQHSSSVAADETAATVYAADADGKLLTLLPDHDFGEILSSDPVNACRDGDSLPATNWTGVDGAPALGVARCIRYDGMHFSLVVEQPTVEAFSASRDLGAVILLITLEVALLLIFVTMRLAASITQPLRDLRRGAKAIGEGNFEMKVQVQTGDEIEELAEDFDQTRRLLKTSREREQYLGRMKSEFISVAAHQLRTPLTAMRWGLEELEKTAHDDNEKQYLSRTQQSAEQLIRLVNDLLNITRIEEGRFNYSFRIGDLLGLIKKVGADLAPRLSAKSLSFEIQDPKEAMPKISFDQEKMEMVISNLIDNAIRYTPGGGKITISFTTHPTAVSVIVEDSGIGIPKEDIPNLFAKFFRAKNAVRADPSGSGLGLFVVRQIIEAHSGAVAVDSEVGKGTKITLTLPVTHTA